MSPRRLRRLAAGFVAVVPLVVTLAAAGPAWSEPDTEPPTAPPNLQAVDLTLTSVRLDWDPSTDNVGVTLYRVFDGSEFVDYTTGTEMRLWNLLPGTTFDFRVLAVDAAGNVSEPSTLPVTTPPDTQPPTDPGAFRVTGQTSTSVRLSWSSSVDNDGGSSRIDYLIDDGSDVRTVPMRTSTTFTGLPTNRVYTFTIRARDRSGNLSGPSEVSVFIENVAPSAPKNLREIGTADGFPVLGWDPAVDNSGEIARYNVIIDEGITTVTTTGTSIRVADLVDDQLLPPDRDIHTFVVTATDPSNNTSAASNTLLVTVPVDSYY